MAIASEAVRESTEVDGTIHHTAVLRDDGVMMPEVHEDLVKASESFPAFFPRGRTAPTDRRT
ncbi:MAG: hypothetical protein AAF772_01075 [Acidobacteriota bacterium]